MTKPLHVLMTESLALILLLQEVFHVFRLDVDSSW